MMPNKSLHLAAARCAQALASHTSLACPAVLSAMASATAEALAKRMHRFAELETLTTSHAMKQNGIILRMARILALLVIAGLVVLVCSLSPVAAFLFVALTIFFAVARAKAQGFWSGVSFFLKEILFGW